MKTLQLVIVLGLLATSSYAAVPDPAVVQERPIEIIGATIHTVSGSMIENGVVAFEKGKITFVGPITAGRTRPPGTLVIEASGKHVYPGLIQSHSRVGLEEISAVRATRDYSEVGKITPNVRAEVAINPESEVIPVTRSNGVLMELAAPEGLLLQGQSALVMLDGWTWEEMTLTAPVAVHLVWPAMGIPTGPNTRTPEKKLEEQRQKNLEELEQAFIDAEAYRVAKQAAGESGLPRHQIDSRWEAMIPVLEGELPVVITAGEIRQIQGAIAFANRHGLRLIIHGGYDAPLAIELLRRYDVPVIVDAVHRLPARRSDPYDHPFTVPDRLYRAGIRFCIAAGGRAAHERNLPYQAATAAAYGLPPEEALKAITLYPAQILGVYERVGSIDVGKDATIFISDGDILEIPTRVEMAFIQGRDVDLSDKQKVLYVKYQEKYRRLGLLD